MDTTNDALKSKSQLLVEVFMSKMGGRQPIPVKPTDPGEKTRVLRADLILEEAFETINDGLGIDVVFDGRVLNPKDFELRIARPLDLVNVADGLADLDVVGPCGTASACGIAMEPIKAAVDGNNLMKFAPGHYWREDGKLVKPKDHPDIQQTIRHLLNEQGAGLPEPTDLAPDEFDVVINARQRKISEKRKSYEQIVEFAFDPVKPPDVLLTVTYGYKNSNQGGSLLPGQSVQIQNGMIFNVADTSNA